jgi:hypothetical protein
MDFSEYSIEFVKYLMFFLNYLILRKNMPIFARVYQV